MRWIALSLLFTGLLVIAAPDLCEAATPARTEHGSLAADTPRDAAGWLDPLTRLFAWIGDRFAVPAEPPSPPHEAEGTTCTTDNGPSMDPNGCK